MAAYRSRVKAGIEAYRKWESGASDWKPKNAGATRQRKSKYATTGAPAVPTAASTDLVPKSQPGGTSHVTPRSSSIRSRYGPAYALCSHCPEDLTEPEAKRLVRFVESLAITDQLAITTGEGVAE